MNTLNHSLLMMRLLNFAISMFVIMPAISQAEVAQGLSYIYQGQPEQGIAVLQKDVDRGDREAMFYLATTLLFILEKDIPKGLELLQKAASLGSPAALDTLAGLYLYGEFVPQDPSQALQCYKRAADFGYGPSQFNCGIMYKNGEKVPQDLKQAFIYLALAARNTQDLDDLVEDAASYRDQVQAQMQPEVYQDALRQLNALLTH